MARGQDFLCVIETWLSVAESSTFTELLPENCCYINTLRISGRGGGIGKCKQIFLSSSFTSFRLSLFKLGCSHTVLCAEVYRPPKYNKDFLTD